MSLLRAFFVYVLLSQSSVAGTFMPPEIEITPDRPAVFSLSENGYVAYVGDIKFYMPEASTKSVVTSRWPDGVLIVEFDESVSDERQDDFFEACENWSDAGVSCIERGTQEHYYVVQEHDGEGCDNKGSVSCAPLGYQTRPPGQPKPTIEIHVDSWDNERTVPHEIGHAFGLIHEHSRSDRDQFVTYQPSNVHEDNRDQFEIFNTVINTDYDYLSVMHYRNCDFSIHADCSGDEADIPLQSLYVTACGLSNTLGGNSISDLDIDTLRAAYNPALAAAFGSRRSASCGQRTYSKSQIASMCGDGSCNSGTVDPVQWTKYNEISGSDCGFAPIRDYPAMCTAKNQEYIRHWFDKDPCSCHICTTVFEWWVACGCSVQEAQSKCTDFNTPLTAEKALDLANSGDPKFAAVGSLVTKMLALEVGGNAEQSAIDSVGPIIAANLDDPDFSQKFKELSSAIRILAAARLQQVDYRAQRWTLTESGFRQFVRRVGLEG